MAARASNRIFAERGEIALGDLGAEFARRRLAPLGSLTTAVAFVCDNGEEAVGAAYVLSQGEVDGLILPRERDTPAVVSVLRANGFAVQRADGSVEAPDAGAPAPVPGRISLLTSGTTGVPKLVHHRWDTLFTLRHAQAPRPHRWLLTYQIGTYAWFQMVTLGLFLADQELVVGTRPDPSHLLELARRWQADAISSTPTFWRFAILQVDPEVLRAQSFRQVTLGGERVDQAILDQLRSLYPSARISHIYASTEVGAAIVVSDGREGFPSAWLDASEAAAADTVRVRVQDGRLWVRSPHASLDHRGWVDTGDRVEMRGDRVVIVGRGDASFINVGGLKISAYTVEEALLREPGVAWCRVYARTSSLMGSLVAADVVLRAPATGGIETETRLAQHAERLLPEYAVPRLWRILDSIPMTENMKSEVS